MSHMEDRVYFCHLATPIGYLRLRARKEGLLAVDHVNQQEGTELSWVEDESHPHLRQAREELEEYFLGKRRAFQTALLPEGTGFQKQVWEALRSIPYAETVTYSDIACTIGNPKAVRAVGAANGKNPLSIFIPCHRVIGKSGTLTGYAGGLEAKEVLLTLERRSV